MDNKPLTLLILNGKGAGNDDLRKAITALREEGFDIAVRVTFEKGDGDRYVKEAIALQAETVVAGGGDGTINEIATALAASNADHRPVLGILPLGTANDFATSVGIPEEMEPALRLAIQGKASTIDLARVNQDHYFINMATGGFGTRITTETPEKLKSALGGVSYFIHGLMRMDTLKPDTCEISGPDFNWQGDALVIGIGNGRQAGGDNARNAIRHFPKEGHTNPVAVPAAQHSGSGGFAVRTVTDPESRSACERSRSDEFAVAARILQPTLFRRSLSQDVRSKQPE